MPAKITPAKVYELLGQSLFICNSIELRIKLMLLNSGCRAFSFGSEEEFQRKLIANQERKLKLCMQPLGNAWKEVLECIYEVPSDKEFDKLEANAEKEGRGVFQASCRLSGKGMLSKVKRKMKIIIDYRNFLVHRFAGEYDLNDQEACNKAFSLLKSKLDYLKKALEQFSCDCQNLCRLSNMFSDKQCQEQITQILVGMMKEQYAEKVVE